MVRFTHSHLSGQCIKQAWGHHSCGDIALERAVRRVFHGTRASNRALHPRQEKWTPGNGLQFLPLQAGSTATIKHVKLQALVIHLVQQHPKADASEELPVWVKLFPAPSHHCLAQDLQRDWAGSTEQHLPVAFWGIQDTKSVNAGEWQITKFSLLHTHSVLQEQGMDGTRALPEQDPHDTAEPEPSWLLEPISSRTEVTWQPGAA